MRERERAADYGKSRWNECFSTVGIFQALFRRKQSCNYESYDVNLLLKKNEKFSFLLLSFAHFLRAHIQ